MKKNEYKESEMVELFHWAGISDNVEDFHIFYKDHKYLINSINHFEDNALIIAVRQGNINITKYLVENTKINIKHKSKDGNALFQTLYINNKELFKYLLSLNKINLKEKNHKEESLYHIILNKGFEDLFHLLLEKKLSLNVLDENNQNVLFSLVDVYHIHQDYMLVEYVLEHINKKILNTKNKNKLNIIEYIDAKANEQKSIIMKDHVKNQLAPLKNTIKYSM